MSKIPFGVPIPVQESVAGSSTESARVTFLHHPKIGQQSIPVQVEVQKDLVIQNRWFGPSYNADYECEDVETVDGLTKMPVHGTTNGSVRFRVVDIFGKSHDIRIPAKMVLDGMEELKWKNN